MSSQYWSAEEYDRQAQRHFEAGDYDGALEILRRGEALYPAVAELKVSVGYTHLAREEYVWAKQAFGRALALEPDHEDALVGIGESFLKLGERARGLRSFERVLDLGFGRDLDLMLSVGRALFREELHEHAERFFRRAIEANPRSADAAADLAYARHRQGDLEDARFWLERSVTLDADNHDARSMLGNILYEQEEWSKALAEFEQIPLENMWDPISVWRLVELRRAHRTVSEGAGELDPYLDRLDKLFVEPSPEERLLMEVELEQQEGVPEQPAPKDQLDLFRGDTRDPTVPSASASTPLAPEGSWAGIVKAMCESSGNPQRSVEEYMKEMARRVSDRTGIQIPDDDPEAFLKASARAGVLHIDR
jgi:Flp pilus assembly protein TadD